MKILDKLLFITTNGLSLVNTWWCIFVSDALPSQRIVWWTISTFICIWLMSMFLIDTKENKNEDK